MRRFGFSSVFVTRQLHLRFIATTMLSLVRPTLTPNGLLNSLRTIQRCSVHNGTAASRTVAALLASPPTPQLPLSSSSSSSTASGEPHTHFRITLRRSGISLGKRVQGTLAALGLRRRMQTVYHSHTPEAAGMILAVKELVEVQNVPASAVRTAGQQRKERKAQRGFVVVGSKREGSSASGLTL
jgi:large subunit ribosomal protein L30